MKIKMLLVTASLVMASVAHASPESSASTNMCFFSGVPSSGVSYTIIKNVKIGKGTYGPVTDVLPLLAAQANKLGADAIIINPAMNIVGLIVRHRDVPPPAEGWR